MNSVNRVNGITAAPPPDTREAYATADFGMWVFIGSEILFFGALLLSYAYGRSQWPAGFAAASRQTDVLLGTFNTALLLSSSFCAALAVAAREAGDAVRTSRLLMLTASMGVAFLAVKGIEYRKEWHEGLFPGPGFHLPGAATVPQGAQLFFAFYFVATGLHALHVAIGAALVAWLAVGQRRGRPWAGGASVATAALYWHFVDIVWVLLYPLLYLVGRHP